MHCDARLRARHTIQFPQLPAHLWGPGLLGCTRASVLPSPCPGPHDDSSADPTETWLSHTVGQRRRTTLNNNATMALWAQVQSLPGVRDLYGPHFPMEIRHFFAAWLESQQLYVGAQRGQRRRRTERVTAARC